MAQEAEFAGSMIDHQVIPRYCSHLICENRMRIRVEQFSGPWVVRHGVQDGDNFSIGGSHDVHSPPVEIVIGVLPCPTHRGEGLGVHAHDVQSEPLGAFRAMMLDRMVSGLDQDRPIYRQAECGLLGVVASWEVGLELNIFGLVFGIDPLDPAIKLPMIGRIGPSLAGAPRQIDLKGK